MVCNLQSISRPQTLASTLILATSAFALVQTAHLTQFQFKSSQSDFIQKKTPRSHAVKCTPPIKRDDLTPYQKPQRGEDSYLLDLFGHLCGGKYIEMGALDGIIFSNTHVFNKALRWKGVLIEPNPRTFQLLRKNRPNEIATLNFAVCNSNQKVHFVAPLNPRRPLNSSAVSGILEFAPESFRKEWRYDNKLIDLKTLPEIDCVPLRDIISRHLGEEPFVDFFSLDVEGGEYEVLKSIDFAQVTFGILVIVSDEHNVLKNISVRSFLENQGYVLLAEKDSSLWFANGLFHEIYEGLIYM